MLARRSGTKLDALDNLLAEHDGSKRREPRLARKPAATGSSTRNSRSQLDRVVADVCRVYGVSATDLRSAEYSPAARY